MIDFLFQYGLFFAKALTIVLATIIILSAFSSLAHKGKREGGTWVITSLNNKMEAIHHTLQSKTLPKEKWKKWLKTHKDKGNKKSQKPKENKPRLFVLRFDGDIRASQTDALRESISAIIGIATPPDEVLIILESAGGLVHSYGLAASQLARLRQHQLTLTVAIDKLAASGGYLMACVANKIIAAPFAIIGSIGVIAQLPNFHRLLDKNQIDFEQHTAGKYKRTLTVFGKNTEQARQKFQAILEETHQLFKQHIALHRPQVDIEKVATGEHWHANLAKTHQLIDTVQTSDDFILEKIKHYQIFEVQYQEKRKLSEKLTFRVFSTLEKYLISALSKLSPYIWSR